MLDAIEHVIYINLDHRTDRKNTIEKVLSVFPSERVHRLSATKHEHGIIGCCKSHIAALKLALKEEWNTVLIVEDDAVWSNIEKGVPLFNTLMKQPHDVILLGGTHVEYDPATYQVVSSQTTTAYVVEKHYYKTLLENFETGCELLEKTGNLDVFALDMFWKHLQSSDSWYIVAPSLMIQSSGYSDINKSMVSYESSFI